jgi:hypothetical protein
LQQVALVAVLEDFEFFLGQVAFDFGACAGADGPESDIESGGRGRVLADLDGVG